MDLPAVVSGETLVPIAVAIGGALAFAWLRVTVRDIQRDVREIKARRVRCIKREAFLDWIFELRDSNPTIHFPAFPADQVDEQ